MKKTVISILCILLAFTMLAGCSAPASEPYACRTIPKILKIIFKL